MLHQEPAHVPDDLATGGRRGGGPCGERSVCSVEGLTNVVSGGEWEFAEAVGQMGGVGGLEGRAIAGRGELPVDDVVAANSGFARWVLDFHVFQAGFQNMSHGFANPNRLLNVMEAVLDLGYAVQKHGALGL